jgi:hypothetical protein
MTGTDALFGQTSDSRIGFWLRRVLAFIAGNLVVHFLPVGVIFRGCPAEAANPSEDRRPISSACKSQMTTSIA